jgi:hypothetical protein
MNRTCFVESTIFINNSATQTNESWFIPLDILMIMCTTLAIILATFFLLIIILDKTCHTVPMLLVANSCLAAFIFGCSLLSIAIFTLENDLKQIQYQDSLCVFRGYLFYASGGAMDYSYVLQAAYRYIIVVYPNRLFWQSLRFQIFLICLTWLCDLLYPFAFLFTGDIIFIVNDQICQLPLRLSFSVTYIICYGYVIPVLMIMFIYLKLVQYVKGMSKRVTSVLNLARAQRELKMVERVIILLFTFLTLGVPYVVFFFISFFTNPPKYHFRIAFMFMDVTVILMMITLFQFTDPLKTSIKKIINGQANMVIPIVT